MPIRLKSLELQGYKTFASRTLFEFSGEVTAIVGPNGSGKSNIADSLRWVLGEQSYGLLRARKTEDMIFSGSQQRPRAGMASVTVLFDNSENWLPIDFSEVALTRRAYRDGKNEYLLNGQQVRLRDIRELLAQAGLSQRTYTILGQGMVDASLALKPEDRRTLFEEAAGVGLYRSRREEAIKRLETTRRNLDRVLDIMAELKPRLRYLERQARKASEHATLQADLRILLRDWYGYHWHRSQRELVSTRNTLQKQEARLNAANAAVQEKQAALQALDEQLRQLRADLDAWRSERSRIHRQREAATRQAAVLDERLRALSSRQTELEEELKRLDDEIRSAQARLDDAAAETRRLTEEEESAQAALQAAQEALSERRAQRETIENQTRQLRRQLDALTRKQAERQARLENHAARLETLAQQRETNTRRLQAAQKALQQAAAQLQARQEAFEAAEEALVQAGIQLEEKESAVNQMEQERKNRQEELANRRAEIARLQAEREVLAQAEQSLSGYAEGARRLLQAARQSRLSGVQGALSAALNVPAHLEHAIAAALGELTDAILLENAQGLETALALLAEEEAGRAALLPLAGLKPSPPLTPPSDEALIGLAAEAVECAADLRPVVDLLLGRTLIVRDRAAARRLAAQIPSDAQIVTLQGELFSGKGAILAGKISSTGALGRVRRQRELQAEIARLNGEIARLESLLSEQTAQLNQAFQDLSAREQAVKKAREHWQQAQKSLQQAQLTHRSAGKDLEVLQAEQRRIAQESEALQAGHQEDEKALASLQNDLQSMLDAIRKSELALVELPLDDQQKQVSYWEKRLAVAENALREASRRQKERQNDLTRLQARQNALQEQIRASRQQAARLEAEAAALRQETAQVQSQLDALQKKIHPAEDQERRAEQDRLARQKDLAEAQHTLNTIERTYNQVQLDLTRRQDALDTLRGRIEEDFGLVMLNYEADISGPVPLPLDGLVESLPDLQELPPGLEREMKEKRAILRRMGAVNVEAREEYEKESERYAFMEAQVADLRQAEADLRQVIAELDEITRREFMKTYQAVSARFSEIFERLFGGGSARLILTDPENLTDTGVEIEARLPGRRRQGLSLLSGGERSLTAIALVFALLKVSPTPLCVMDEVDAMLDEANVGRFRDLLEELSRDTQFIIITHNRNTVQAADVIYGVTMGRDSASQIISLRLDEISDEMLSRG